MRVRAGKNTLELVETQGMWIGVVADIGNMIGMDQLVLYPGDVMLLYTDGVTESTDQNGNMFSDENLQRILQKSGNLSPEEIKASILQALNNYTCSDDITLVIIKRLEQKNK